MMLTRMAMGAATSRFRATGHVARSSMKMDGWGGRCMKWKKKINFIDTRTFAYLLCSFAMRQTHRPPVLLRQSSL